MLQIKGLELLRAGKTLLKQANVTIYPGHKVGVIGRNGCGKSSLFGLIQGQLSADQGDCFIPKDWRIASVKQETPALAQSAYEYVLDGDHHYRELQSQLEKAEQNNQGEQIALIHQQLDIHDAYSLPARCQELLAGLGFSQEKQAQAVASFSGGWRMRLNLAQALISPSELLLLDEPTNHLDLDTVIWLGQWLQKYPGTLLLISHDKSFLNQIVRQIIHIEHEELFSYTGNYSQFEQLRGERLAHQQIMYDKQQRVKTHLEQFVTRFKAKASKAKQAQSRVKALEKLTLTAPAQADSPYEFQFFNPGRIPSQLLRLEGVSFGYEPEQPILSRVSFELLPGDRIALLGKNGAGKSTFIQLLTQQIAPQSGEIWQHMHAKVGYFAQHQLEVLDIKETPIEHLQRLDSTLNELQCRQYLGSFSFSGDKALTTVETFSGGEKARLALALLIYQKPNVLLMDEPTNHLDLEMRQSLALALQAYEGALIVVSHDRSLLELISDQFYLVENQQVQIFDGNLTDYERRLLTTKPEIESVDKPKIDRKQQKRLDAEFRQKVRPLKQKIDRQEQELILLEDKLASIEHQLTKTHLYESVNKPQLTQVLSEQTSLKQQQQQLELVWLENCEQLEQIQQKFEQ